MNTCSLAGRLASTPKLNGKKTKALFFILETKSVSEEENGRERISYVPCVAFDPSQNLHDELAQGENLHLQLQGRVQSSRFEADGEQRYKVQVVVDKNSITIVKNS